MHEKHRDSRDSLNTFPGSDDPVVNGGKPHTSTLLLLFSCYVRLLHIFELLVQTLRIQDCTPSSPTKRGSVHAAPTNPLPLFRMAHSRVTLPSGASLSMHLVAISSMIRSMKDTMVSCISQSRSLVAGTESAMTDRRTVPSMILAELAKSEVSVREEALEQELWMAKSVADF